MVDFKILSVATALVFLVIFLPLTAVHGQGKVANSYFSVKIPDTWTYVESSDTSMSKLFGRGPVNMIVLAPAEFGDLLANKDDKAVVEKMHQEGAVLSAFRQDTTYDLKNSPLETYVKYRIDGGSNDWNVTSTYNGTIDKEKAVKLTKDGIGDQTNQKMAEYLVLHDKDPYLLTYSADKKHFDKYLPEFETMVRSFKFVN